MRLDVAGDESLADAAHENEGQTAVADFLVLAHEANEFDGGGLFSRNIGDAGRQPDRAKVRLDASGTAFGTKSALLREAESLRHADRDALAVQQPSGIAAQGFECVAERMTEIE